MASRLLLIAAVLIGLYLLSRWWRRTGWKLWNQRLLAILSISSLLLLLTLRGGVEIAAPLLTVLAPLLLRWLNQARAPSSAAAPPDSSKRSTVTTRFLFMELDHATGQMSGTVLDGRFARRSLSDLTLPELLDLRQECQADSQSLAVLETYLDRRADPNWREQASDAQGSDSISGTMDRREAYQVLGLQPDASPAEIQSAYRRLMQRVHPDHGGSAYLAARLNKARDVLLG